MFIQIVQVLINLAFFLENDPCWDFWPIKQYKGIVSSLLCVDLFDCMFVF